MPVYDYKCLEHGIFNELASLSESQAPKPCPHCCTLSARIIMMPPRTAILPQEKRKAYEVNEKSQHEPMVSTEAEQEEKEHYHHTNCGCSNHSSDSYKKPSKLMYTAEGDKMFPSSRPWMISH